MLPSWSKKNIPSKSGEAFGIKYIPMTSLVKLMSSMTSLLLIDPNKYSLSENPDEGYVGENINLKALKLLTDP